MRYGSRHYTLLYVTAVRCRNGYSRGWRANDSWEPQKTCYTDSSSLDLYFIRNQSAQRGTYNNAGEHIVFVSWICEQCFLLGFKPVYVSAEEKVKRSSYRNSANMGHSLDLDWLYHTNLKQSHRNEVKYWKIINLNETDATIERNVYIIWNKWK